MATKERKEHKEMDQLVKIKQFGVFEYSQNGAWSFDQLWFL